MSNEVKLHPTDITKASSFLEQHAGKLISPPESFERVQELGLFESHEFQVLPCLLSHLSFPPHHTVLHSLMQLEGEGWRKSCSDIVIAGLGWVAVTGVGPVKVIPFSLNHPVIE